MHLVPQLKIDNRSYNIESDLQSRKSEDALIQD